VHDVTAAVVVLAVALAGAMAAVAAFAWAGLAAERRASGHAIAAAVANGRADNTKAALETSERLRQAERRRGDALEEEIHAIETDVAVPGAPGSGRNRLLKALRDANDAASGGDPAAASRGAAGELLADAAAEAVGDGDEPASVPR